MPVDLEPEPEPRSRPELPELSELRELRRRPAGAEVRAPVAPSAQAPLASRLLRLVAFGVDGVLLGAAAAPLALSVGLLVASELLQGAEGWAVRLGRVAAGLVAVVSGAVTLGLLACQWHGLATEGQTIGKRWAGVRVVRLDGSPADFLEAVVVRSWVSCWLLVFVGLIPYAGQALVVVAFGLVLGPSRRCLHDRLAGTKVVSTAPPVSARRRWTRRAALVLTPVAAACVAGALRPDLVARGRAALHAELAALRGRWADVLDGR